MQFAAEAHGDIAEVADGVGTEGLADGADRLFPGANAIEQVLDVVFALVKALLAGIENGLEDGFGFSVAAKR